MSPKEENYALVEGEWNDFVFHQVQLKDIEEIEHNIRTEFLVDEPTCKLLGPYEGFCEEFIAIVKKMMLDHQMSFIVRHKSSGEVKDFISIKL